jgi:two-component system sensor histidine kinase YesM
VPLSDEINHAEAYIRIQMARFSNRIETRIEPVPDGIERQWVPKLILQPLIENAYTHGLGTKLEEGLVILSFVRSEQVLQVVIEDNGDELQDSTLAELHGRLTRMNDNMVEETTGIINVHKRLQLKFGKEYGLIAERSKLGGLKITMKLPRPEEE